eukprot:9210061-Lingulodinium_polyedra.AAC.1
MPGAPAQTGLCARHANARQYAPRRRRRPPAPRSSQLSPSSHKLPILSRLMATPATQTPIKTN